MNASAWPDPPPSVQSLIDKLNGVQRTGANQWQARCPNPDHDDATASFGFRAGDRKPVIGNCFGCDDWQGIQSGLADLGIDTRSVGRTVRRSKGRPVPQPRQTPIAKSPTLPDQGKPAEWHAALTSPKNKERLAYLTRERGLSEETIKQFLIGHDGQRFTIPVARGDQYVNVRRYDPAATRSGDKMISFGKGFGSNALAFTEVLSDNELPVIVAEGEWDALLLNQKGIGRFVAVTGTGGATNVPKDLSALAGREVFVALDADDAGRDGTNKWTSALADVARTVHVLDLTHMGLPFGDKSKKDWSDYFLKAHGKPTAVAKEIERLQADGPTVRERFKTVTAAELAAPVPPMRWLVKGVWPEASYGVLAGEKKTLKTYTGLMLALAVASGEPFLGEFVVPQPQPVLMYLGEGGQLPTMRRVQRLAESMRIDLASLPLRLVFDAGDITGEEFLTAFERKVQEASPGLVIVDPLYAFHPAGVEAQNLYDRGAMLAAIQRMLPPGAAFILADHFRKTGGKDLDLDSIAQSGVAQWADSWILQNHASSPRVDDGEFSIGMQFGSRQWGGQQYVAEWSLGQFDAEAGEHQGDLQVVVQAVGWGEKAQSYRTDTTEAAILALLEASPLEYTLSGARELVKKSAGVGSARVREAWGRLVEENRIIAQKALGSEGKERERWRVVEGLSRRLSVSEERVE